MICPECENKTFVIDCKRRGKKALYRRYECKGCKKRFSTLETYFVARETKNNQDETKAKNNAALEIVAIELGKAKSKHPVFPENAEGGGMIIAEEYIILLPLLISRRPPFISICNQVKLIVMFLLYYS